MLRKGEYGAAGPVPRGVLLGDRFVAEPMYTEQRTGLKSASCFWFFFICSDILLTGWKCIAFQTPVKNSHMKTAYGNVCLSSNGTVMGGNWSQPAEWLWEVVLLKKRQVLCRGLRTWNSLASKSSAWSGAG